MEALPKTRCLEFNPNTLSALREQYNYGTPKLMNEAIDILEQWLQKQDHLTKKDFSREYLERSIIISKDVKELLKEYNGEIIDFIVPKLTEDNYRVYILQNCGKQSSFLNYFKFLLVMCEYFQSHDYCNGVMAVFDYRKANVLEIIKALNLVELRQVVAIITEGYSLRLKGLHFITPSKAIDAIVTMMKQVMSEKLAKRIFVHNNVSSLGEHIAPLDILPEEYGGKERSAQKLHDEIIDEVNSNEFMDYLKELKSARSDESKRHIDKFNDLYMGTPGSFRTLNVD
ncbi:unnamed protein product [Leptosia nina]|uniref:CRAL-TRIO domain-containing protein n=1 Tax=Leptosia nina TaxID=320188 RepID=A0AAV1IY66_9NEOP